MRLLVFQHHHYEHPGSLRKFLAADGVEWHAIELDEGEKIPALEDYDMLWVMGGAVNVWDVDEQPWLIEEKAAIRRWVGEMKKPYLGICLGHQLLADALSGTCGPQHPPEIGVLDVQLTEEGKVDPIMAGLPHTQKCLLWHGVQVAQPPDGAVVLASTDVCRVQAMRVGENAWSVQYHAEVESDTIDNWGAVPSDVLDTLENAYGPNAHAKIKAHVDETMPEFLVSSETLYRNFMNATRG